MLRLAIQVMHKCKNWSSVTRQVEMKLLMLMLTIRCWSLTSAACAAFLRASSGPEGAPKPPPLPLLPSFRGGPPTLLAEVVVAAEAEAGTEAVVGTEGMSPRRRPGCAKASDSLPQKLPILFLVPFLSSGGGVGICSCATRWWLFKR